MTARGTASNTETAVEETAADISAFEVVDRFPLTTSAVERRGETLHVLESGSLRQVDLSSGETVRTVPTPNSTPEHLVLDGTTAYCAGSGRGDRSTLAAVNLEDGSQWRFEGRYEGSIARPILYDEKIAYASATTDAFPDESGPQNRSKTYVLDAASGSVTWEPTQSPMNESTYINGLAVDSGVLIVFADSAHIYDLQTEGYVGNVDMDAGWAPPTVVDGRTYAGGTVASCFDMETREVVWQVENPKPCRTPPVVNGDVVYFPTERGLSAHDPADGRRNWFSTTMRDIYSGPLSLNGVLWVGANDGIIYAFDESDGSLLAEGSVKGGRVESLLAYEGSVYVKNNGGVYELRPV